MNSLSESLKESHVDQKKKIKEVFHKIKREGSIGKSHFSSRSSSSKPEIPKVLVSSVVETQSGSAIQPESEPEPVVIYAKDIIRRDSTESTRTISSNGSVKSVSNKSIDQILEEADEARRNIVKEILTEDLDATAKLMAVKKLNEFTKKVPKQKDGLTADQKARVKRCHDVIKGCHFLVSDDIEVTYEFMEAKTNREVFIRYWEVAAKVIEAELAKRSFIDAEVKEQIFIKVFKLLVGIVDAEHILELEQSDRHWGSIISLWLKYCKEANLKVKKEQQLEEIKGKFGRMRSVQQRFGVKDKAVHVKINDIGNNTYEFIVPSLISFDQITTSIERAGLVLFLIDHKSLTTDSIREQIESEKGYFFNDDVRHTQSLNLEIQSRLEKQRRSVPYNLITASHISQQVQCSVDVIFCGNSDTIFHVKFTDTTPRSWMYRFLPTPLSDEQIKLAELVVDNIKNYLNQFSNK